LSTAVNTRPPLTEITNGSLALKRQPAPEDPPTPLSAALSLLTRYLGATVRPRAVDRRPGC
ncbi:hypothetical protein ACIP27_36960, partial [Streptomyces hydrogenans]|uniref:hypothetical protein n=1 Tax=Streptomyces hydrogenans TaxID=1873719 RepID=UPI0038209994